MKIGILGTRGIPNTYGGFEQFAEILSAALAKKDHQVYVYNSHLHSYRESTWVGVNIIHCYDWEKKLGTAGQFIYDMNCINDARKREFDVLLHLGYTSDSVWYRRWPRSAINLVNMDGLEWKRSKYTKLTKWFLQKAEAWAARHADHLISDSIEIRKYLLKKYNHDSTFIPYGAEVFDNPETSYLTPFQLQPWQYHLTVSRLEPENNIEMIIRGHLHSQAEHTLVIVGSLTTGFGKKLKKKYGDDKIKFVDGIYNKTVLNNLRYFSKTYFHGHSAGGTNPSLLEAMACGCRIAAHDNIFNRAVLENDANYFSNVKQVSEIVNEALHKKNVEQRKQLNLEKIRSLYNWNKIIKNYEELMLELLQKRI
jgi:glycosyltransferase involved in cell wall biosynthesis